MALRITVSIFILYPVLIGLPGDSVKVAPDQTYTLFGQLYPVVNSEEMTVKLETNSLIYNQRNTIMQLNRLLIQSIIYLGMFSQPSIYTQSYLARTLLSYFWGKSTLNIFV